MIIELFSFIKFLMSVSWKIIKYYLNLFLDVLKLNLRMYINGYYINFLRGN